MCWWVLFTIWMQLRGIHYPKMNPPYATVFDALKPKFENAPGFKGKSERTQLWLYMFGHMVACLLSMLWAGLCWNNMVVHTLFIIFAFVCSVVQGSSWYLYAMQKASIKQVKALMSDETEKTKLKEKAATKDNTRL